MTRVVALDSLLVVRLQLWGVRPVETVAHAIVRPHVHGLLDVVRRMSSLRESLDVAGLHLDLLSQKIIILLLQLLELFLEPRILHVRLVAVIEQGPVLLLENIFLSLVG